MNKAIILIFSVIVVIVSLYMLVAVHIPNIQRANEEVRIAQMEYDQSQAELDAAMDELNQTVEEISNQ